MRFDPAKPLGSIFLIFLIVCPCLRLSDFTISPLTTSSCIRPQVSMRIRLSVSARVCRSSQIAIAISAVYIVVETLMLGKGVDYPSENENGYLAICVVRTRASVVVRSRSDSLA